MYEESIWQSVSEEICRCDNWQQVVNSLETKFPQFANMIFKDLDRQRTQLLSRETLHTDMPAEVGRHSNVQEFAQAFLNQFRRRFFCNPFDEALIDEADRLKVLMESSNDTRFVYETASVLILYFLWSGQLRKAEQYANSLPGGRELAAPVVRPDRLV